MCQLDGIQLVNLTCKIKIGPYIYWNKMKVEGVPMKNKQAVIWLVVAVVLLVVWFFTR